jgi:REP element-mobilizing transposase RayT
MPQSLARVLVHIVFSTRDRKPWLDESIRGEMHAYLATVVSDGENASVRVGGIADRVHIAIFLSRTESIARLVERLKVSSSKWVKSKDPRFAKFSWQKGYAAFSVGLGDRQSLIKYIDAQASHHQRRDFQAELRAMFAQYDVVFDERYVWE